MEISKKVSIIGSCVCRDTFKDDNGNYSFFTDIRFTSPISMLSKPVPQIKADFIHLKRKAMDVNGNWFKKTLLNDINKTTIDALKAKHGDYLIMDMAEARMNLATIHWPNLESTLTVTNSGLFRKHYRFNLSKNIMKNTKLEITRVSLLSDEYWDQIIRQYAEVIHSLFQESNIILIKNMPASYYLDENGCLHHYETPSHCTEIFECNILLPKLYDMFLKYCPNVNVIEIPKFAIGDANHIWKTNPFHFTKRYYDYLLDCVNAIIDKEKSKLGDIFAKYSELFYSDFEQGVKNQIDSFYSGVENRIDYKEIIDQIEEFKPLGRKKRGLMLLAASKKDFVKNIKRLKN